MARLTPAQAMMADPAFAMCAEARAYADLQLSHEGIDVLAMNEEDACHHYAVALWAGDEALGSVVNVRYNNREEER